MEINITEINYIDVKHTAFADICRFDRITEAAIVYPEAQKVVDEIRKIPKNYRHIPNDTTQIKGNTFERELYFKLNVPNQR